MTKNKSKKNFIKSMENLKSIIENNNKHLEQLRELFGSNTESSMQDNLFNCIDELIAMIASNYDINKDAVDWLVYECRFGENPLLARYNKREEIIDSINKFWDFEKWSSKK